MWEQRKGEKKLEYFSIFLFESYGIKLNYKKNNNNKKDLIKN